jgi:predicted aldo/keto reductase-like oxidoreductase
MASGVDNVLDYMGDNAFGYEKTLDPERAALYQLCEQKGVAITVMKTLGAGKLLSKEHTPFSKPLTVGQCIHYALTRPAVVSALLGYSSGAEVLEAVKYLDMSDEERDYSAILEQYQGSFKGNCVYCNHCLPCPSNINIASVNKYLDIAVLNEAKIPPSIVQHYKSLEQHGSDCIGCGSCEKRCPFSVPVIKNMERAAALFGI